MAFTPNGDRLTVALDDGTVRSWNPRIRGSRLTAEAAVTPGEHRL